MKYIHRPVHVMMLKQSLEKLNLERNHSPIMNQVDRWIESCGIEWTVARLKHLKVLLIQLRSCQELTWKWVAHKGNLPKGVFRPVFQQALKDDRYMSSALSVLQYYTVFISKSLTKEQEVKAKTAITVRGHLISDPGVQRVASRFKRQFLSVYTEKFSFAGWNTSKPTMVKRSIHPWIASFLESCFQGGPWTPILQNMGVPHTPYVNKETVGKITCIQEKGYKARVVASPNAGAQVAFRPLHLALGKILKGLKTDCTHDQFAGARWAQRQLREGKRLWSVDLSSATDRFPLEIQLRVLHGLGYQWTNQFAQLCRSRWVDGLTNGPDIVYGAGQPMGLYGSFALFGLTHNFLLTSLGGTPNDFRVLGDDIIISNGDLYKAYENWLMTNSVPVSWHKTILNSTVAEFAGFLITADRLIKGVKYPDSVVEPWSFVEMTKTLRYPIISVVPRQFRQYAMHLVELPEVFGGCGLNPKGRPTLERVMGYYTSLEAGKIPKLKGPNMELQMPMASYVPGAREILLYLDDQTRLITQKVREKMPLFSFMPDEVLISQYMAVSQLGVPLWKSSGNTRSVIAKWKSAMLNQTVKPQKWYVPQVDETLGF